MTYPETKLNPTWIYSPITKEVVDWCKSFGEFLSPQSEIANRKPLTTSQLRKFFGEVKRIQLQKEYDMASIAMLNPLLAYAVGRDYKNGRLQSRISEFQEEMSKAINAIRPDHKKEDYNNFILIFEAIVAYHKYYGGKDGMN